MKRKIVKQGAATMMISLPAKWIKKHNLHKGDELEIDEEDSFLRLSLEEKKDKKETEINITNLGEVSIRNTILMVYRLGYDRVKLRFKKKETNKIIEKTLKEYLIGFDITEKTDDGCVIENITEPSIEQFDNIFSKLLMNIEEMFDIVKKRLEGKEEEFLEVEGRIIQYGSFCRRVSSKVKLYENTQLYWDFNSKLMHSDRELYHLLKSLEGKKIKVSKYEFDLLEAVKDIFNLLKKSYLEKDISPLEQIQKRLFYKQGYEALKKSKNPIVIHHLLDSVRFIYLASITLMGIIISERKN